MLDFDYISLVDNIGRTLKPGFHIVATIAVIVVIVVIVQEN